MIPVYVFKQLLKLSTLPREDIVHFQTLEGFIHSRLGRIPSELDNFTWNGFRFEVINLDRNRIDKVLGVPQPV